MIKTEYKINFEIDDESFNIIVKEPSLKERKELELKADEQKKALEEIGKNEQEKERLKLKADEIEDILEINRGLIKEQNIIDKAKLYLENKALIKELSEVKRDLSEIKEPDLAVVDAKFEELLEFKSSILISGADKERLLKTLKNKGISNQTFWNALNKEAVKELEKK